MAIEEATRRAHGPAHRRTERKTEVIHGTSATQRAWAGEASGARRSAGTQRRTASDIPRAYSPVRKRRITECERKCHGRTTLDQTYPSILDGRLDCRGLRAVHHLQWLVGLYRMVGARSSSGPTVS
jgi:hypothetical protein